MRLEGSPEKESASGLPEARFSLPILGRYDALIAGSGTGAMLRALRLAESQQVILISEDTCLYADMHRTGDYRLPLGLEEEEKELLFPESLREAGGSYHPDRLKRHGERLMKERGVALLYACQVLGQGEGAAIVAHKSGLYAVIAGQFLDARGMPAPKEPAYCLHTMRGESQEALLIPTAHTEDTAEASCARYAEALEHLPPGSTLARGGTYPTGKAGLAVCRECVPLAALRPGTILPTGHDPVAKAQPKHGFSHGLAAQEQGDYDVIVAGGGTAGAACALFAARAGLRVLLLEMNEQLGGTATVGGVSTYWFGLRDGATAIIDQAVSALCGRLHLPRKACLWNENDTFPPDLKAHALLSLCLEANVDVRFGSTMCGVQPAEEGIRGVYWARRGRLYAARAAITVDCTGDGDVCVFAGADSVYGNARDGMTYWASLAQYTAPDRYKNNFSTMVHVGDPWDYTRFILAGRLRGESMYDHGAYVAVRESRHIRGLDRVTLRDLLTMEPPADPLYDCFSNYDPKGRLTADFAYFGLLCPNLRVGVPRGAVIPVDGAGRPIRGLLVGGKAISCTHDAFPILRMQPDLQRQGLALAALAACAIRQGVPAWQAEGVAEEIAVLGGVPPERTAPASPSLQGAVQRLTGEEPWEWLDAPPDDWETRPSPVIRIMTASPDAAVPLLAAAWRDTQPGTPRRLALSRLLLWHGDERGAEDVMGAVWALLARQPGLPRRQGSVNYGQMLPDHGLMPEAVYLLNSLSRTKRADILPLFREVLLRLERDPRDWKDLRAGVFCYCESFAYVALRRRERAMIPLLRRVLALPELAGDAEDVLRERFDILNVILLHALHVLGDEAGTEGLRAYLSDDRRPFRLAAESLLCRNAAEFCVTNE